MLILYSSALRKSAPTLAPASAPPMMVSAFIRSRRSSARSLVLVVQYCSAYVVFARSSERIPSANASGFFQ